MPTIRFPWTPGLSSPGLNVTKTDDDLVTASSDSCTEFSSGIYDAVFASLIDGDYYIVPTSSDVEQDGVGVVHSLVNDSNTYLESELVPPGVVTVDEGALADAVVAGILAIPGFAVETVSPTDEDGEQEVRQGDAYLAANSRHLRIELTGSLPSLEAVCIWRVFFGGTKVEYTGSVQVISSTNYFLKLDLTGTQTAAMPVGTFSYEVETTYLATTNKWTPSSGKFRVLPQIG